MRCPHCNNKLLQKAGDTVRIRVQGVIEVTPDGVVRSHCYWCKRAVAIPLTLRDDVVPDTENLILREPDKGQLQSSRPIGYAGKRHT